MPLIDSDERVIQAYTGEGITIRLPGDLTVYEIEWLSMYCVNAKEEFGHVGIPKGLSVPPRSRTYVSRHKYFIRLDEAQDWKNHLKSILRIFSGK